MTGGPAAVVPFVGSRWRLVRTTHPRYFGRVCTVTSHTRVGNVSYVNDDTKTPHYVHRDWFLAHMEPMP